MKKIKNIKHNIIKIISVISFILVFISINAFTKMPEAKNETVYVNLNYDGSVKEEKTVNWLYITASSENDSEFIDYGKYSEIKNMNNGEKPKVDGSKVIWPYNAFKSGSLFYEGTTKKALPIDVSIKYFLEGKEIKGEQLAGKSGNIKIEIKIKNNLKQNKVISYTDYHGKDKPVEEDYYVPLMVQVSLKADITKFSKITADSSMNVLTGKDLNISFADFPFPESNFIIEMYGKDIELNPINIVVIPSKIPVTTDLEETEKNLYEFDDGLIEMEDGCDDIVNGNNKLNNGLTDLKNGSGELVNAISDINSGLGTLKNSSEDMTRGLFDINSALNDFKNKSGELVSAVNQLSSNIVSIKNGLDQSASGASTLSANTAALAAGMGDLKNNHGSLVAIAESLVSSDPTNVTYQQLLAIANGEMDAMNSMHGGMQAISDGMGNLSGGLSSLAGGITQYGNGVSQLSSSMAALPSGLDQLIEGYDQLISGWSRYSGGVSEIHEGTDKLYTETQTLPDDIGKIIDGNIKIRNGIKKLKNEGISEIRSKIIENIDKVKSGTALTDEINSLYKNYNSFMDNDNNLNSQVQFIMQTDEIKQEKTGNNNLQEEIKEESFWDRFINLFKKE